MCNGVAMSRTQVARGWLHKWSPLRWSSGGIMVTSPSKTKPPLPLTFQETNNKDVAPNEMQLCLPVRLLDETFLLVESSVLKHKLQHASSLNYYSLLPKI